LTLHANKFIATMCKQKSFVFSWNINWTRT